MLVSIATLAACVTPKASVESIGNMEAEGALALLRKIYTLPNPDFTTFHDKSKRPYFYTPRIHELALKAEACFYDAFRMRDLDYDYIVPGQDFSIHDLRMKIINRSDDQLRVHVSFDNIGNDTQLDYLFVQVSGKWLIDDTLYGSQSLGQSLSESCQ